MNDGSDEGGIVGSRVGGNVVGTVVDWDRFVRVVVIVGSAVCDDVGGN